MAFSISHNVIHTASISLALLYKMKKYKRIKYNFLYTAHKRQILPKIRISYVYENCC